MRRSNDETWDFPGGRTERGELPMATALREAEEEAGWTPFHGDGWSPLGEWRAPTRNGGRYVGFLWGGSPFRPRVSPEHTRWAWMTPQGALTSADKGSVVLHHGVEPMLERLARRCAR